MNPQFVFIAWFLGTLVSALGTYWLKIYHGDITITKLTDLYKEFDTKYQITGVLTVVIGIIATFFYNWYTTLPSDLAYYLTIFFTSSGILVFFNKIAKELDIKINT